MHDKVCSARPEWHIARHELVRHALADALARLPCLDKVRLELFVHGTHLRTDLSLSGSQVSGTGPQDFDITIIPLASGCPSIGLSWNTVHPEKLEGKACR